MKSFGNLWESSSDRHWNRSNQSFSARVGYLYTPLGLPSVGFGCLVFGSHA